MAMVQEEKIIITVSKLVKKSNDNILRISEDIINSLSEIIDASLVDLLNDNNIIVEVDLASNLED